MKAIIAQNPGSAGQLLLNQVASPQLKDHELMIEVKATSVNRLDIHHRKSGQGHFPILGVEAAGIVVKKGIKAKTPVGSRVMGLTSSGSYAQYTTIPDQLAMDIPDNLSFDQAAGIPEVFLTAYQTLYTIGKLKENESVLIHAGASGVGTAAIQLAKTISNAKVLTTAGSQKKIDDIKKLGADVAVNYKKEDFSEVVKQFTKEEGVSLILDFIGSSYYEKNLQSIATDGRWVLISVLGGSEIPNFNLQDLLVKRISLHGTLLSPRSIEYKAKLVNDFIKATSHLFDSGKIHPIIDKTFSLSDAKKAHDYLEADKNIGKIILRV